MFCDWINEPIDTLEKYFRNGGFTTIQSFLMETSEEDVAEDIYRRWASTILEDNKEIIDFLVNLPFYYETDSFIFVHAGINPDYDDWKNTSNYEFIWIREPFLNTDHRYKQTIVHGHTPTFIIQNNPNIYFGNKKIGIDGACVFGHQLNCLEIKDGNFKQYFVKKEGEFYEKK
jgi:serine/threonine protein phosphatase 1